MATLQIRVDDALKLEAERLFTSLGLDTSTAIRIFLKSAQILLFPQRERRVK